MSEEYSADVRMWIEMYTSFKGERTLLDVASIGPGEGVLVSKVMHLPRSEPIRDAELCIEIDGTLRREAIEFTLTPGESFGGFKYRKLELSK